MLSGLLGRKLGMTQIFDEQGNVVPVTVIQAGPCVVVQTKTRDKDGYDAVQLGLVEPSRKPPKTTRPLSGHFGRAGVPPTRRLREFRLVEGEEASGLKAGAQVLVGDVFAVNESVDVAGRTIGRGFQGVVKRHGFAGGRATHGSMFHRAPGSIGASADPSRVYPGLRAPGQMGNVRVKKLNLKVVAIDTEKNLLLVKGAVPGSRGNYLEITRSR